VHLVRGRGLFVNSSLGRKWRSFWTPVGAAWLTVIITSGVVLSGLLWNLENSALGRVTTASWLESLNSASAFIAAISTLLYLHATWKLLTHSRSSLSLTQELTTKIHADTQTPELHIASVSGSLRLTSRAQRTVLIHKLELASEGGILMNGLPPTVPRDEILLIGDLKVCYNNLGRVSARIELLAQVGMGVPLEVKAVLASQSLGEQVWSVEMTPSVGLLLKGPLEVSVSLRGKGPGISAFDEVSALFLADVLGESSGSAREMNHYDLIPASEKYGRKYVI